MAPKVKHSKKGHKDKAVKRKEEHKIKWNPNSAHKDERIQLWTQEKMVEAMSCMPLVPTPKERLPKWLAFMYLH